MKEFQNLIWLIIQFTQSDILTFSNAVEEEYRKILSQIEETPLLDPPVDCPCGDGIEGERLEVIARAHGVTQNPEGRDSVPSMISKAIRLSLEMDARDIRENLESLEAAYFKFVEHALDSAGIEESIELREPGIELMNAIKPLTPHAVVLGGESNRVNKQWPPEGFAGVETDHAEQGNVQKRSTKADTKVKTLAAIAYKTKCPGWTLTQCAKAAGIPISTLTSQPDWQEWRQKIDNASINERKTVSRKFDKRIGEMIEVDPDSERDPHTDKRFT